MLNTSSLQHLPANEKWEFDASVVACFEDMLQRSIPLYSEMRDAVAQLARQYIQPNTDIVDLGASLGEAVAPLVQTYGAANRFILCESSKPMLGACEERYAGYTSTGVMRILELDLRAEFPQCRASLIQAVLTLQFIPVEYRQAVVQRAYERLVPGGALIVVEKVLGACAALQETFEALYYAKKAANGYTREEIYEKRKSLEGVLVPLTPAANEEMLRAAGFTAVDCFYRWMNFAGWVAVKGRRPETVG